MLEIHFTAKKKTYFVLTSIFILISINYLKISIIDKNIVFLN